MGFQFTSRRYDPSQNVLAQRWHRSEPMAHQNFQLTTQEAAAFLNVSPPFVIKEIEASRLACRLVNRHRRIEFEELLRYQSAQKQRSEDALKKLSKLSQEMGEAL